MRERQDKKSDWEKKENKKRMKREIKKVRERKKKSGAFPLTLKMQTEIANRKKECLMETPVLRQLPYIAKNPFLS